MNNSFLVSSIFLNYEIQVRWLKNRQVRIKVMKTHR